MAQAYEYKVVTAATPAAFASALATEDTAGWEVIGFSSDGGTSVIAVLLSALLRRRV